MITSTDELLCCPFCGSSAKITISRIWPRDLDHAIQGYSIVCSNDNCIIYNADGRYYKSKDEAKKAWNRRIKCEK